MPHRIHPYRLAWSFRVARIFGIDIKVHLVFFLLLLLIFIETAADAGDLAVGFTVLGLCVALFAFVLLHELGHSLVAQRLGVRVHDITLWPLGGMARLETIPEIPAVELRIAMAGPAVNFGLVLAVVAGTWVIGGSDGIARLKAGVLHGAAHGFSTDLLSFALTVNAFMGAFNLLPAFPMDGGRILRALAARRLPYLTATTIAVAIGKVLALAGLVLLLYEGQIFSWPALLCIFIMWAGSAELRAAREREFARAARRGLAPLFQDAAFAAPSGGNDGGGPRTGAEIIETQAYSADESKDRDAGRTAYRDLPETELRRYIDRCDREFLRLVERYRKRQS